MNQPLIQADGLSLRYGKKAALDQVSFSIPKGRSLNNHMPSSPRASERLVARIAVRQIIDVNLIRSRLLKKE